MSTVDKVVYLRKIKALAFSVKEMARFFRNAFLPCLSSPRDAHPGVAVGPEGRRCNLVPMLDASDGDICASMKGCRRRTWENPWAGQADPPRRESPGKDEGAGF